MSQARNKGTISLQHHIITTSLQYHYNIITTSSLAYFSMQVNKPVKIIIFHKSAMTSQGDTPLDMLGKGIQYLLHYIDISF
jgi:hypothetical protein